MSMKPSLTKRLDRRSFFRSTGSAAAGISLASYFNSSEDVEAATQNVNKASKPSELKITDLRVATLRGVPFTSPLIRIDTNQGIYGLGEVRDGASKNYALVLKSRLLGEIPATWTRCSARSSNLETTRARQAVCVAWRWRYGTWLAKRTTFQLIRC